MTITVQLQMQPTVEQKLALEGTLRSCNAAADWISERGFANGVFSQFALQTRFYKEVRTGFGLGAQGGLWYLARWMKIIGICN